MTDDSNSENDNKSEKTSKPKSKAGKPDRTPDQVIKDIIRRSNFALDIEKQLGRTHDLMRAMQESTRISRQMESIVRYDLPEMLGLNSIGEAIRLAAERARDVIESAVRYPIEELKRFQESIMISAQFRTFKDIIGDLSENYAWMDTLRVNPVEDALEKVKSQAQLDLRDIFKISSELKEVYENLSDDEIIVQDGKTIVYDGQPYDISEIRKVVDESLEAAGFFDDRVTRKDFAKLSKEIKKSKETHFQKIIWIFICIFLSSIFGNPIETKLDELSNRFYKSNRAKITKHIKNEIPKLIEDETLLGHMRLVTDRVLNVRRRNYQRSLLLGKLYLGEIVFVIEKKKNWTLIQWQDEDNDLFIRGWVFSRYLKKFKP